MYINIFGIGCGTWDPPKAWKAVLVGGLVQHTRPRTARHPQPYTRHPPYTGGEGASSPSPRNLTPPSIPNPQPLIIHLNPQTLHLGEPETLHLGNPQRTPTRSSGLAPTVRRSRGRRC